MSVFLKRRWQLQLMSYAKEHLANLPHIWITADRYGLKKNQITGMKLELVDSFVKWWGNFRELCRVFLGLTQFNIVLVTWDSCLETYSISKALHTTTFSIGTLSNLGELDLNQIQQQLQEVQQIPQSKI